MFPHRICCVSRALAVNNNRLECRLMHNATKLFDQTGNDGKNSVVSIKPSTQLVLTGNARMDAGLNRFVQKMFQFISIYEEMIGLKDLKTAQNSVIEAERNFVQAQESRRSLNAKLLEIQNKLKDLRDQMDRLSRTDGNYLKLFTHEHETLNEEQILLNEYKAKEASERDLFFKLSASLRESQEKERTRAESVKYLQLSLSIACTFLGLVSALLFSFLRKTEIQEILNYEKNSFSQLSSKLSEFAAEQQDFVGLLKDYLNANEKAKSDQIKSDLCELIKKQNTLIEQNVGHMRAASATMATVDNKDRERQQFLVRLLSLTTVLSTVFIFVNYFSKS